MRMDTGAWDALRAAYVAGSMSLRALAASEGVAYTTLRRRAASEGWQAARRARAAAEAGEAAGSPEASEAGEALAGARDAEAGDVEARLRTKLLLRLERIADGIPDEVATEVKCQDGGRMTLFKIKDLTAAYKDLAGSRAGGADGDVEDLSPLEALFEEQEGPWASG